MGWPTPVPRSHGMRQVERASRHALKPPAFQSTRAAHMMQTFIDKLPDVAAPLRQRMAHDHQRREKATQGAALQV